MSLLINRLLCKISLVILLFLGNFSTFGMLCPYREMAGKVKFSGVKKELDGSVQNNIKLLKHSCFKEDGFVVQGMLFTNDFYKQLPPYILFTIRIVSEKNSRNLKLIQMDCDDINQARYDLREYFDPQYLARGIRSMQPYNFNNALEYSCISDNVQCLKYLFVMKEKEINRYYSDDKDSRCYLFYKDTMSKMLKHKSRKCFEWVIKEDPLKVNNHLVYDAVDCYKPQRRDDVIDDFTPQRWYDAIDDGDDADDYRSPRWKTVGGPILNDLWDLFPKNQHGNVNFAEYSRLEELCKKNGCKTKYEIVNEYEKRKTDSLISLLQVPDLIKEIQKQTLSESGWHGCAIDKRAILNMRLTCKNMNNAVVVPPLKEALPYLAGEILLGQGKDKYCTGALRLAIARDETDSLCKLLNKNMNFYKETERKYKLYVELVRYAIEKDSSESFKSLVKQFDCFNNFRLLYDIEHMCDVSKEKKEKYISLCKENGCKSFDEMVKQMHMDRKQQKDL